MLTLQHLQVKLLAEPWDCGMYQVGTFPNWDVWGEWNGKFRDDFRYCDQGPSPLCRRDTHALGACCFFGHARTEPVHQGRQISPLPLIASPCTATLQALHQG